MDFHHLDKVEMSYFSHAKRSLTFATWSLTMTLVNVLHAFFPWILTETFSCEVLRLSKFFGEDHEERTSR